MATLESRLASLITALGVDYKAVQTSLANLSPTPQIPSWISGKYYGHAYQTSYGFGGAGPGSVGNFDLTPLYVPLAGATIDRMTLECTTTGVSAALRLGLYNSDANGAPNNLVKTFGVVDASVVGERAASDTYIATHGLYWMAVLVETSTGAFRFNTTSIFGPQLGYPNAVAAGGNYNRLSATSVPTGALPSPLPALTPNTGNSIMVRVRSA